VDGSAADPDKLDSYISKVEARIAVLDKQAEELDALNLSMSEAPVLKAA